MKPVQDVRFVHAADGFRLALTEVRLDRESRARGPVFLLLPGFAQNRAAFLAGDLPLLLAERGAQVFIGELRGHGLSVVIAGDSRNWTLGVHLGQDLPALVERALELGRSRCLHLVGHSMGGMLAVASIPRMPAGVLASVTTFAAPLAFHGHSPLLRLAGLLFGPVARGVPSVRMDLFLGTMAPLLIARGNRTRLRAVVEKIALASARTASHERLAEILESSDVESPLVLAELAEMAVRGQAVIDGVQLRAVLERATLPIATIIGPEDVLAPRASLLPLESARGPRLVLEIRDALHVDLLIGRHARDVVDRLWAFLLSA